MCHKQKVCKMSLEECTSSEELEEIMSENDKADLSFYFKKLEELESKYNTIMPEMYNLHCK